MTKLILGIDTSNYTTSVAVVDISGQTIADERKLLDVDSGKRGLRQSEAFFQHVKILPSLIEKALNNIERENIVAIAVSNRPRSVEGSYMPVFMAGENFAKVLAIGLGVPMYTFSHQEGHIEAISAFNNVTNEFICFHISGGTTEILKVTETQKGIVETICIGGSLDISFGQVIDRVGVALGYDFPSGESMDKLALKNIGRTSLKIKGIIPKGLYINLSGLETQLTRLIDNYSKEEIAHIMFTEILLCLQKLIEKCNIEHPKLPIVIAGGVSESEFLKKHLGQSVIFGSLGADNAVGIALLGGKAYGNETH